MQHEQGLTPSTGPFEIPISRWALWVSAVLVFLVVMTSKVRYTDGDSRYSLLASMALVERGTLCLDYYASQYDLRALNNGKYWQVFHAGGGKQFYDYPVGTPIFTAPFVLVGRWLGMNPLQREDDGSMQIGIAAILCVSIFLFLHRLSRLYLGEWAALAFSLAMFFGTTLSSTMGTALWSHTSQTFFVTLAMLELAAWERGLRAQPRGYWLGFLLFMAYLCRPTSAALIVPVFAILAWKCRPALWRTMAASAIGFGLFVLWSYLAMGTILPRYYNPAGWHPVPGTPSEHWLPLLFGPARGLWAFMPAFLLVFLAWTFKPLRTKPLQLLLWPWLLLHTFLLARSQSPWAGWSYGPRFYTEMVPGFALVLLLIADSLPSTGSVYRKAMLGFFVVASFFGVYVHSYQGLQNVETALWNDNPNIDQHWEERRWDWRHPQFLASGAMRLDMIADLRLESTLDLLMRRVPEGQALIVGPPDPNAAEAMDRWNKEDRWGSRTAYNSLYALGLSGHRHAYFPPDMLPIMQQIETFEVDSVSQKRYGLGEFLRLHPAAHVILAAKDECTSGATKETRDYLRMQGAHFDSVKLRDSYILHIDHGKVVHEAFGQQPLEYHFEGGPKVIVKSQGLFVGNTASITVGGMEYSANRRGLNLVMLDENRKVLYAGSFDTHANDLEQLMLLEGYW